MQYESKRSESKEGKGKNAYHLGKAPRQKRFFPSFPLDSLLTLWNSTLREGRTDRCVCGF